ncbi:unnamed protein product [Sphagnum tenellum]
MYGKGIYLTYNFDDQQDERMKATYGPFIIRAKVNLDGFLIFDADIAEIVYGIKESDVGDNDKVDLRKLLEPQFKRLGLPLDEKFNKIVDGLKYVSGLTSQPARIAAGYFHRNPGKVKGLVFTGGSDGRVIVAYDATKVIPYSWARVTDLNKTLEKVKWNKYEAPPINQVVPERMPPQEIAFRYFKQKGFVRSQGRVRLPGSAGGYMSGKVNGDYVTLTITNRAGSELIIQADVTRNEPPAPAFMRALAWTLEYHTSPGEAPLAKVYANIMASHAAMLTRAKANEAFAHSFVKKLLNPGVAINSTFVEGRDYGKDEIHLTAGPIKVKINSPYDKFCHGDLNISVTGSVELRLGFNDGSKRGEGAVDFRAGYQTMMDIAQMNGGVMASMIKKHPLSDDLTDQFKADLLANMSRR